MKYIIMGLFSLLAVTTQAQVRGIVKDNTGEPVPGANVFWVNTGQGVTTKDDSCQQEESGTGHYPSGRCRTERSECSQPQNGNDEVAQQRDERRDDKQCRIEQGCLL